MLSKFQLWYLSIEVKEKFPITVYDVRYSKSLKSRECVYCGCEIPKGDMYYSYKPIFGKRKSRCIDHPPNIYNDYEPYDY